MPNKNILGCAIILLSILFSQGAAYSIPTKWEKVDASLSNLLDSGWTLLGITSNRVAYQNSFSPGGLDEENFIFSLTKNGKYIVCSIGNPGTPVAQKAGCRRIN